ncbi:MAG TPA: NIPSNAP family protein [Beijerinckiaceae bacterium]|nr:NIPSNAP family protein [Beijerinckiaceae bacterium]
MVFELRIYEPVETRAEALRLRFEKEVVPRFAKHGIELMGVFTSPDAPGRLTYLTRYKDEAARKSAWASFGADPEWAAVKQASEADGPLMKSQTISVLTPILADLPLA